MSEFDQDLTEVGRAVSPDVQGALAQTLSRARSTRSSRWLFWLRPPQVLGAVGAAAFLLVATVGMASALFGHRGLSIQAGPSAASPSSSTSTTSPSANPEPVLAPPASATPSTPAVRPSSNAGRVGSSPTPPQAKTVTIVLSADQQQQPITVSVGTLIQVEVKAGPNGQHWNEPGSMDPAIVSKTSGRTDPSGSAYGTFVAKAQGQTTISSSGQPSPCPSPPSCPATGATPLLAFTINVTP